MPPADAPENEITYTPEQLAESERREKEADKVNKKLLAKKAPAITEPEERPKAHRTRRSTD